MRRAFVFLFWVLIPSVMAFAQDDAPLGQCLISSPETQDSAREDGNGACGYEGGDPSVLTSTQENILVSAIDLLAEPQGLPQEFIESTVPQQILDDLNARWLPHQESFGKRALLFLPRFFKNAFEFTFKGRTAQRVANLGLALAEGEGLRRAGLRLSNSPLNVLGTVNDVVSDSISILSLPYYSTTRMSGRIRVCAQNLSEATLRGPSSRPSISKYPLNPLNPLTHVAVVLDQTTATADPMSNPEGIIASMKEGGGIICTPVPIFSGESDSLAVERLQCVDSRYHDLAKYDFVGYNCGGYTRDILGWAGSGFPVTPNFGMGSSIQTVSEKIQSAREKYGKRVREACNTHLQMLRNAFFALESGKDLPADLVSYLQKYSRQMSMDARLQLLVSAARGKNEKSRKQIRRLNPWMSSSKFIPYGLPDGKLNPAMKDQWTAMVVGMDDEAKLWLQRHNSNFVRWFGENGSLPQP